MPTDRDSLQENVEVVASLEDRAKQGTMGRLDTLGGSDLIETARGASTNYLIFGYQIRNNPIGTNTFEESETNPVF
jgi:hypothetical protein